MDHVQGPPARQVATTEAVNAAKAANRQIVVSTIALLEFYHSEEDVDKALGFLRRSEFLVVAFESSMAKEAQVLRRVNKFRFRDAAIVGTAVARSIALLLTRDGDGKNNEHPLLPWDDKIMLADKSANLRIWRPDDWLAKEQTRAAALDSAKPKIPPVQPRKEEPSLFPSSGENAEPPTSASEPEPPSWRFPPAGLS